MDTDFSASPIVLMCRGHSGSRFLAEIFSANGIWLGDRLNRSSDSLPILKNLVLPLLEAGDSAADPIDSGPCDRLLEDAFADFLRQYPGGLWGWKLPESLFVIPWIKRRFPRARFIHLIRDGRDVILSDDGCFGLPFLFDGLAGFPALYLFRSGSGEEFRERLWVYANRRRMNKFHLAKIFNTPRIREWNGVLLNRKNVLRMKYQLGMLSWANHVETARRHGQRIPGDYIEVRYEDLCRDPQKTAAQLFEWLGTGFSEKARDHAQGNARSSGLGKWRRARLSGANLADFRQALEIGAPLLRELGYE